MIYPQPMHVNPTLVYYNPVNSNAEWYNETRDADEGISTEYWASAMSFMIAAEASTVAQLDICIIHYTAVGEMVVGA
jgi:hypothetical protein